MSNAALILAGLFKELREAKPSDTRDPSWGRRLDLVAKSRSTDRQGLLVMLTRKLNATSNYIDDLAAIGTEVSHYRSGLKRWESAILRPRSLGSQERSLNANGVLDESSLDLLSALGHAYASSPALKEGADTAHIRSTLQDVVEFITELNVANVLKQQVAMKVTRATSLLQSDPINSFDVYNCLCDIIGQLHIIIEQASVGEETKVDLRSRASGFAKSFMGDFIVQSTAAIALNGVARLLGS